jgi:hypothetical protein
LDLVIWVLIVYEGWKFKKGLTVWESEVRSAGESRSVSRSVQRCKSAAIQVKVVETQAATSF